MFESNFYIVPKHYWHGSHERKQQCNFYLSLLHKHKAENMINFICSPFLCIYAFENASRCTIQPLWRTSFDSEMLHLRLQLVRVEHFLTRLLGKSVLLTCRLFDQLNFGALCIHYAYYLYNKRTKLLLITFD